MKWWAGPGRIRGRGYASSAMLRSPLIYNMMSGCSSKLGCFRQQLAVFKSLRAAVASFHGSAASRDDLPYEVSEKILAAGCRYLKRDKEELKENLRIRNANVNLDQMVS